MKIGVLASNPNLYSNRRIIEAGEERGHEMVFLNIKHCYMKMDADRPEVHYRGGNVLNDLDAVIPRIRPSMTFYGCALARQFESMGVYCLNTAAAITQSRINCIHCNCCSKAAWKFPSPVLQTHHWKPPT